ncbi:hypothetical protein AOQ84DRAFT_49802 [Glonium stellatum]|uniref:Uncharacterized protein n=1 Tax=Glonium stellatum TaxID=574774 RepID=A0A8E2F150_9PEZI|nr:hypothetical protein AOQ84DRAFT_49802 [Glonium stellatum]
MTFSPRVSRTSTLLSLYLSGLAFVACYTVAMLITSWSSYRNPSAPRDEAVDQPSFLFASCRPSVAVAQSVLQSYPSHVCNRFCCPRPLKLLFSTECSSNFRLLFLGLLAEPSHWNSRLPPSTSACRQPLPPHLPHAPC